LLDLGENREELRGSPETLLTESTVAKLQLYYFRIRPLHTEEIMASRRGRKEELPLTFKYCMIDKLARQRRNHDVRRRPRSADYNIVGSYNLQPESGKLFAGQTPRVSSSNIPVFHPDRLQMVSNNMIPQYHLHFLRTMRLHLDLNATPAANSSEDFVADFRGSESSLKVQSASTHGEAVAVAPFRRAISNCI